ncbi:hypothetical protein ACGF0J_32790 [Nonomuraea sp. NPDC047897]|uniref:hypothetical protein n=1 Tax=Nonomuraea sp. NPDC047897 TaxID=3364346 RepID=UPI0037191270
MIRPSAPPAASNLVIRDPFARDDPAARPVPVGTTLHLRAWCNGIAGRKAYLEAEGRIGASDGPVAVRAAALFVQVDMEHFARHGDAAAIAAEHHEFEVNP